MDTKTYAQVTAVIFAIVALAHLARILAGWEVSIGGWDAPMWVSWLAVVVAGFLSWAGCKTARRG